MTENEIKFKRYTNIAKFGGLALVAVVLMPVLFSISLTILTTMAIASAAMISGIVTVAIGLACVNALPAMSLKAANWKLGLLKAEAKKNPIETAQNQLLEWNRNLDGYKTETAQRLSQYNSLKESTEEIARTDPKGAATFQSRLESFAQEIMDREENIRTMTQQLDEATGAVEKASRLWKLEQEYTKFASPTEAKQALDKIILNEALGEVMRVTQDTASRMRVEAIVSSEKRAIKEAKQMAISKES